MSWEKFGSLLRKYRRQAGYGLREFAALLELSPTYISRVENGYIAPPTTERLHTMAKVLRVDADELYGAAGKLDPKLLAYAVRISSFPAFLRRARKQRWTAEDFDELAGD